MNNPNNNQAKSLLIEILSEELPPRNLYKLSNHFGSSIFNDLKTSGLISDNSKPIIFATPRRIAVLINQVLSKKDDYWIQKKGPAVTNAYDQNGNPTKALIGFANACKIEINQLEKIVDNNREFVSARILNLGANLQSLLPNILEQAISSLPVNKKMRWQDLKDSFVRPVHQITILFGDQIINFKKWNIASDRITQGHRFLGSKAISINNAKSYQTQLMTEGKVNPVFADRQQSIVDQLNSLTQPDGNSWIYDQQLLDEVTAITEFPVVLEGQFENRFLELPPEVLIVTMTLHQKYFPVLDNIKKISSRFLMVSNMIPAKDHPDNIIKGNERVLRARLSDAKFFYDNDCKIQLIDRLKQLQQVTYLQDLVLDQNQVSKAGSSQADRVNRIIQISQTISQMLYPNETELVSDVIISAKLAKADLVSELVGEFPELQGIAGSYYALVQGYDAKIAQAIAEHYLPKFSGDQLPKSKLGQIIALSDKFEQIASLFGLGKIPTGEKDPYALRRLSLGIIRILVELKLPLDLKQIYQKSPTFFENTTWVSCEDEIHNFMIDRLRYYLRDKEFRTSLVESVVANSPTKLDDISERLHALNEFIVKDQAISLITIGKRIRNILKSATDLPPIKKELLIDNSEQELYQCLVINKEKMQTCLEKQDFHTNLLVAISFETPLAKFFDQVMVMVEDQKLRNNRLSILNQINQLINQVGIISEISI